MVVILLCPYCLEPASAMCEDPRTWVSHPRRRFGDWCGACGVWQDAGKPHRACEVCLGEAFLRGVREVA